MAPASHQLRIKYGLGHEPDTSEIARWAGLVRQLISEGIERESAGERAAMQLFTDFRIRHFASQADTIDTLLRSADRKSSKATLAKIVGFANEHLSYSFVGIRLKR